MLSHVGLALLTIYNNSDTIPAYVTSRKMPKAGDQEQITLEVTPEVTGPTDQP